MNDNVIGVKEKKSILSSFLIIIGGICLIILCIYKILKMDEFQAIMLLYIGIGVMIFIYVIKYIIDLIKYFKMPKELIFHENDILKIYVNNQYEVINISDITKIKDGENDLRFLFYTASMIIETNNKNYSITNIDNYNQVKDKLLDLIKG